MAPLVIDGPLNAELFGNYVVQHLVPALRPGDILVLDNLPSHKAARALNALAAARIEVRFLPPYSPDLNPIENAFAKLKGLLRSAAERTVDALWSACGKLLDLFPPQDFIGYIRSCGYRYG